jgi:ketosteroid isomerase-like protein
MRRRLVTAFLLVSALIPACLSAQRTPDPERDAVRRVIAEFAEHIQANDLSALDASPEPVQGRGTAVLEKRDGRWVIVHLHMSQ